MIVRNWMIPNPITVTGDTLVSEAQGIVEENNLRFLCVVDQGELRGFLTRKNLSAAASWVARQQNIHEVDYFNTRLKVKDLMTRNPETVGAGDTVEYTMLKGQQFQVSAFPVMDGDRLVGLVSPAEIFQSLGQVLGVDEKWCGVTLTPVPIECGTLGSVAKAAEAAGACLEALFTMASDDPGKRKVILRFGSDNLQAVVDALTEAGFEPVEITSEVQACAADNGTVVC